MSNENLTVENKIEYTDDVKKEVLAFANSLDGTIFIGIDNKGNKIGVENPEQVLTQATNAIRDSILPDVTMFVKAQIVEDNIIRIDVSEGTNKPYYLADKGLKPSGVYVRQGASKAQATNDAIRQMIKITDGDKYENLRSMEQNLTFDEAKREFEKRDVKFGNSQMKTLGIKGNDDLYTNLGVLLSDQCTHTVKVAVFTGTEKGEFKTRKELSGSLLNQLHECYDFISLNNNLQATFSGLDRIEKYDYPEEAIREALLNAIIHRDYAFSGSIIINIYDDRMEFVSLGGLVAGLSQNDIMLGVSQPRNEKLANVFYRLKHIEAYGTGIKKIMNTYKDEPKQPEIEVSSGAFVITIPNRNFAGGDTSKSKLKQQHKQILEFINKNSTITKSDVEKLLDVKQTRAYGVLKEMLELKLIAPNGAGYINA